MDKRTELSKRREAAKEAIAEAERKVHSLLEVIDGNTDRERGQRGLVYMALDALCSAYRDMRHIRHTTGLRKSIKQELDSLNG